MSRLAKGLVLPLLLLSMLEAATRSVLAGSDTVVAPTRAIVALGKMATEAEFWHMTAFTLGAAGAGFALAMVSGVACGVALGLSRSATKTAFLTIEVMRPLPSIALAPLALIVFGFGARMEIAIIAFACFWPILVLAQSAVQQVEPRLLEVGYALGLSAWDRARKIIVPALVPRLFVMARLGVAIAMVVAITVEVAINPNGMGYGLVTAQQSLDPASMMAWLGWIAATGYALNALALRLQRLVERRHGVES